MYATNYPLTISVCDRAHGSQISIATVRLRHVLFEDTLDELVELLRDLMIRPLAQGAFPLFDIREQLTDFFSEGGDVLMDENLNYYDGDELVGIMQNFDPVLSFTLYYPHNHATRVHLLRNTEPSAHLHESFRMAQLLHQPS